MEHPYEHRAHYNERGDICHCPWGWDEGGEHLGSVKEALKLDWLKKRPDMQNDDGQWFLNWLDHPNEQGGRFSDADKLLPWLVREWQKNRIEPRGSIDKYLESSHGSKLTIPQAIELQNSLEEMQKRRQGVDVMQHKFHELLPKVQDFQDWKDSQSREGMGEILHQWPDGWSVRRLSTPNEYADEGERMGHCIGNNGGANDYSEAGALGTKYHVSLRDHNNMPHATMELTPSVAGGPIDPDAAIGEFYGKEDRPPLPEYENRMREWLEPKGVPFEWEENPEVALYQEREQEAEAANEREWGGLDPRYLTSSVSRPLYYRWVFSPQKGVTINSNQETHPALVRYHNDLSGDINDLDLSHGYASAIGNGWRITDLAHQPVEDPYIVNQVVRRLNLEDGPQMRSEGSWRPSQCDFERLHYGLPQEAIEK